MHIEGSGSANWWRMSREENKLLFKTKKISLEFNESMYIEMEGFIGKKQIFGRATNVVKSDRVAPSETRQFVRSSPIPGVRPTVGVGNPLPAPRPHLSLRLAQHQETTHPDQRAARGMPWTRTIWSIL